MKILIAGGGIGGMTAALCLARDGHEVHVFEQAVDLAEVGAGIQLSPNCTRVLHHLGLEASLRQASFLPEGVQVRHWRTGRVIAYSPLGDAAMERYGFPYYHIHRGDLLALLIEAARRQPNIILHTGTRVCGFAELDMMGVANQDLSHSASRLTGNDLPGSSNIEARSSGTAENGLLDGSSSGPDARDVSKSGLGGSNKGAHQNGKVVRITIDDQEHEGDVLIGADGIHSAIRAALWGDEKPAFTGNIAWRALVPATRLPKGLIRPKSTVWWGPGGHFVHYFVRGGELVNCVCVVEKQGCEVESWTEPGDYHELQADFSGWHEDLQVLIDQADRDSLYKWALFDRPPMSRWGRGHVTLLGDACHPTLPFMAQGAAMAIEDAAVLASCLSAVAKQSAVYTSGLSVKSISAGLRQYEDLRRRRTADIQKTSRRNATIFHLTGWKAWLRNLVASRSAGRVMDDIYGYNALEAART